MPRGRPRTTGTGHAGPRVRVSPETVAQLDELARDGETRPQVVARVVGDMYAERAALATALDKWADEGCDPWMSYCADRVRAGDHHKYKP